MVENARRLRSLIENRLNACVEQEKKFEPSMLEPELMNSWDLAHSKRVMLSELLSEFDVVTEKHGNFTLVNSPSGGAEVVDLQSVVADHEKNIASLRKRVDVFRGLNRSAYRDDLAYRAYAGKRLINIGAGHFYHDKWTNLDVSSDHYKSHRKGSYVEYNIITDERIPFEDASVAVAYTSHTIEHIKDHYVFRMFREAYRCLEPGGIFRVTCPNADLFYTAARLNNTDRFFHRALAWFERHGVERLSADPLDYLKMAVATGLTNSPRVRDENEELWNEIKVKFAELPKEQFLDWLCGHVDFSINNIARHINWWTVDKVTAAMKEAGFELVRSSVYGGSLAAPMCDTTLFDNTMPDESLYVEAYKLPA
jgi:SAM-dependent methyltransferase